MKSIASEKQILIFIVLIACLIRSCFLWIGRPEFVGWFNHTYYYYVQTRSILVDGQLAYADMPFLFYLYALSAKVLSIFGLALDTAIVSASRFWMCVIPSLMAVPSYYLIRQIRLKNPLDFASWALVIASSFLPLSILHQTEFAQKNVLGILLLLFLMLFAKLFIEFPKKKFLWVAILLPVLIVLTHFGSAGTMVLFGIAILIASFTFREKTRSVVIPLVIGLISMLIAIGLVYVFDVNRFHRIMDYALAVGDSSFVAVLLAKTSSLNQRMQSLLILIIPALASYVFYRFFKKRIKYLERADRIFWLSQIIFFYLLLLPIYEPLLWARFAQFIYIPILIILAYVLHYSAWKSKLKKWIGIGILGGILFMLFGEVMSMFMQNRDKAEIYESLQDMQANIDFHSNDLIITQNGAEHICNWFLHTKAALIPAINKSDFDEYETIYILNPSRSPSLEDTFVNNQINSESDRYYYMMHEIPRPVQAEIVFESPYMQLFKIDSIPAEWIFDPEGNWVGYR